MSKKNRTGNSWQVKLLSLFLTMSLVFSLMPNTFAFAAGSEAGGNDVSQEVLSDLGANEKEENPAVDAEVPDEVKAKAVQEEAMSLFQNTAVQVPETRALSDAVDVVEKAWVDVEDVAGGLAVKNFHYRAGESPAKIFIPKSYEGKDIVSIAPDTFESCALTEVWFDEASALSSIGTGAFQSNQLLTSITLPAGVTTIADETFSGCMALSRISFSQRLSSIGVKAFYNCTALTSFSFPDSLTSLGGSCFYGSSLAALDLSRTQVTAIPVSAFYYNKLRKVLFPANLVSIADNAFCAGTAQAVTFVIPRTVTSMGTVAFNGITAGSVIDLSAFKPGSIANAPWRTFNSTIIWGPDDSVDGSPLLFNADTGAVCGLKKPISSVEIPVSIELKSGGSKEVKAIADGAFAMGDAKKATSVSVASDSQITSVGMYSFSYCGATSISLPATLQKIGARAFFGATSLTSLVIPRSVTSVNIDRVFASCPELTTVTIGDEKGTGLTSMTTGTTFADCPKLTSVIIPGAVKGSIAGAPWGAVDATIRWKNEVVLPQSAVSDDGLWRVNTVTKQLVAYLGGNADKVALPESVLIGGIACKLTSMGDAIFPMGNGYQFKEMSIPGTYGIIRSSFARKAKIDKLIIGEGITSILSNAFSQTPITRLVLSSTVTTIGESAFYKTGLTYLDLPEKLKVIEASAFAENPNLLGSSTLAGFMILPSGLESCVSSAFTGCSLIKQFKVMQNRNAGIANGYSTSPDAVKGNAPWGASAASSAVYFMDDPQPVFTYSTGSDISNNKVVITLKARMKPANRLIESVISSEGYTFSSEKTQEGDPLNYYTVAMPVTKNGTYHFNILFKVGTEVKSYPCEVVVSSFRELIYDANGAGEGEVPASKSYVPGASVTTAVSTLKKSGFVFGGWSTSATRGNPKATLYAPQETFSMGTDNTTLYAVWLNGTALSLSANPVGIRYGQSVTLKAMLLAAYNPGGTITFYKDGVEVGAAPLGADATVSLSLTNLSAGVYHFTSSYSGDINNAQSKSSELSYTVSKATQAAPAAVVVTGKSYNSLTVSTDSHCRYIVVPAGQSAPETNASGWVDGTGSDYAFAGLNRDSSYDLYAYTPETDSYLDSPLSVVTTAQTNKENITSVNAPSYGDSFPNWCEDAATASAYFPVDATVITEGISLDSLPLTWTCDSYDPTPGVSNTFSWQVSAPSGYSFVAGVVTSGIVSVKNAAALPIIITPHPQSVSYAPSLSFAVADLFTIDVNAGVPSYSVVSGPGELSADKTTVAITGVGTVIVHIDTLAQGSYAAGSADASIIVSKATQAAPAAVVVADKSYNSLTVSTDSHCRYIVVPAGQSAPETNADGWVEGEGRDYTFAGLNRDSSYDLYAYVPKSDNYLDSPLSVVTTAQTNKENITSVSAPSYGTSFPVWCKNAAAAIAYFPVDATAITEGTSLDSLPFVWTCDSYNPTSGVSNTFSWQVNAPSGYSFAAGVVTSGTVSVKNAVALLVDITPHPQSTSYASNLSFAVADLFTIDANAGTASYSVVSGPGELSADKTIVAITGVGTVIVHVDTLAQGSYAAGSADASIIVSKAIQAAPAAVGVTDKTYNSLTVSTDSHCRYIVVPAGQSAPETNASGWVDGTGSDYAFAGLNRDSSYDLYAYVPKSDNYLDSPLSAVTTAQTNKESITSVSSPSYGDSFPNWCEDAAAASAYFPVDATAITEGISLDSLPFVWTCDSYDPTPGVSNTFSWQVNAPSGYSFVAGVVTSGIVSVKNTAALPIIITPHPQTTSYTPSLSFAVANLFTIDAGAGAASYSVVSGPGELSADKTTVAITGVGTVIVHVDTLAQGGHAAGSADASIIVSKAAQAAPAAVAVTGKTYNSLTVSTDSRLKYIIAPAGQSAPETNASGWVDGTGSDYIFARLDRDSSYDLYAYVPKSDNYLDSPLSTVTTAQTNKENITSVSAPSYGASFPNWCEDAAAASAYFPVDVTVTTEGTSLDSLPFAWTCDSYVPTPGVSNTFSWQVNVPSGYSFVAGVVTSGTVSVKNAVALPVDITPHPQTTSYASNLSFAVADLFTIDANASTASYSVVSGPGELSADKTTVAITGVGTVLVHVDTLAQGSYAAGSADVSIIVSKAIQAAPAAVGVTDKTYNSLTVSTDSHCRYIVVPAGQSAPETNASGWVDGTGSAYTFAGLERDSSYDLYAYTPKSDNYLDSPLSVVTTAQTNKENITLVSEPSYGDSFPNWCEDAAAAIAYFPVDATVTTEGTSLDSLPFAWTCDSYDPTPGASNTFSWQVSAPSGYSFAAGVVTLGTLSVKNAEALPIVITPYPQTTSYAPDLSFAVANLFTIDAGAGAASYSVVSGPGELSADKTTVAITGVGTVIVHIDTLAQGSYATGSADASIIVSKAIQAAPAAVGVTDKTYNSLTVSTDSHCRYIVVPAGQSAPEINASGWVDGTGSDYIFARLDRDSSYDLYAYTPKSDNYLDSPLSAVTTAQTNKESITSVSAPSYGDSFPLQCADAAQAIAYLPVSVMVTTEGASLDSLSLTWTCDSYDTALGANNTFSWQVSAPSGYSFTGGVAFSGTLSIKNISAFPVGITPHPQTTSYAPNLSFAVADLFTIDVNAGTASYSVVSGPGELSADKTTVAVTGVGTVIVRVETLAQGSYVAGLGDVSIIVGKAPQAAPAAVAVTGKTYNSLTVSTDSHCRYIVVPAGQSAPETNADRWVDGTGSDYTFAGLNRDSSYDLYAYVPESDNYLDSPLSVATTAQINKENITSVSAPSYGDSFPNWCKDVATAIAYLPVESTITTEGISLDSLPFAWMCDSYDPTPGVSNTFSWQVSAPLGYSFVAGVVTSGTVSVKNAATNSYTIEFLSGTTWTQGSSEGFTVSSSADLARFVHVEVDDAVVNSSNYTATSGSTHITFAPDYLSTLGIGVHPIRIVSADGEAVGTFEILAANEKEPTGEVHPLDQPPVASLSQAGDREGLLGGSIAVVLMLLSAGVGVRARYRKKEH